MNNSNKITLIIPTLNRSEHLKRVLIYYSKLEFKGYIAIGDSSTGAHLISNRKLVKSLKPLINIHYYEYPNLSELQATYSLVSNTKTPYVAELQDDNYIVPKGIDKCIKFLDSNPDFSAARGLGLSVKTFDSKVHGKIRKCVLKKQPSAEENNPSERFLRIMGDYSDVHFSVHRTGVYLTVINNMHIQDSLFFKILATAHTFICGKVKELQMLYLVRHIQDNSYKTDEALSAFYWITQTAWLSNLNVYKNSIINNMIKHEKINTEDANRVFELGFLTFLSHWFALMTYQDNKMKKYYYEFFNTYLFIHWTKVKNDMIFKGFNYIYPRIRILIEKIKYQIFGGEVLENSILNKSTDILLPSLLNEKSRYHEDFMPIYNSITNPPEIL